MENLTKSLLVLAEKLDLDLFYNISIYKGYITLQGRCNENSINKLSAFCNIKIEYNCSIGSFTFEEVLFEVVLTR